jgi:hypothetical protein
LQHPTQTRLSQHTSPVMADLYPNSSANTIYTHLHSLSNTIANLGETVTALSVSTILPQPPNPTMPSFTRPGSIRRRFLRIISFGRYSNGSVDDMQPLTRTNEGGRRYSAPDATDRPMYTAQQSYQSSDSAQTTIIHEMPPGRAPFSVSGLRDQQRGRHISDTEFDTPPSLEVTQQLAHSAGTTHPTRYAHPAETTHPAAVFAENATRHPTRLRRNKSFMQCNVCKRILEYTQFHRPGCAARTLHHVPRSPESSSDSRDIDEPKTLQPRKGRQNEQHDIPSGESSWDTQGLDAGTAEGSWATIAGDVVETVSPKRIQEEGLESSGVDDEQEQEEMLPEASCCCCCCCCCCKSRVAIVTRCYCGTSGTHDSASTSCTRPCTLRVRPITATIILSGSVHDEHACKYWNLGIHHHHICCRISAGENVSILEAASQECICGKGKDGEAIKEKSAWWRRWPKWFCCCF